MPRKKKTTTTIKTQDILKGYALKRVREAHRHIKKRHSTKPKGDAMTAYDSFDEAIDNISTEQGLCPDILLAVLFSNFKKVLSILASTNEYSHESIATHSEKFVEAMKALLTIPDIGEGEKK